MINLNSHIYLLLAERIVAFSVSSFAEDLTLKTIDELYSLGCYKDGKFKANRLFDEFCDFYIEETKNAVRKFAACKGYKVFYFNFDVQLNNFEEYFDDITTVNSKIEKKCKKILLNNRKAPEIRLKIVESAIYNFDNFKCLRLSGENKEYFAKKLTS